MRTDECDSAFASSSRESRSFGGWLGLAAVAVALTAFFLLSYGDALGGFFFLDDFWELSHTHAMQIAGPRDLWKFFEPYPSFLLYRPVSTLGFYYGLKMAAGHDPFLYHATLVAFHVINGMLVYWIGRRLLGSSLQGFFVAVIYALAPGHAIAVYWMALFTMTGTAFFYFAALLVWFLGSGRSRSVLTWILFVLAVLSSEHALSFPMVLTAGALLMDGRRDWGRIAREQAWFYAVTALVVASKIFFLRSLNPDSLGASYRLALEPLNVLEQLGRYLGFGFNPFYDPSLGSAAAIVLGVGVLLAAVVSTLFVLLSNRVAPRWGVVAFGLDLFVMALGPVIFLPDHQQSYYVGIAGLGLALAVVALVGFIPRESLARVALVVLTLVLVGTHFQRARPLLFRSLEFTLFRNGSEEAAGWLYQIWFRTLASPTFEVVVPRDLVTQRLFGPDELYRIFLCPWYKVRLSDSIAQEAPAPGRLILEKPWTLAQPRDANRSWEWLTLACPDCRTCMGKSCPSACFPPTFTIPSPHAGAGSPPPATTLPGVSSRPAAAFAPPPRPAASLPAVAAPPVAMPPRTAP